MVTILRYLVFLWILTFMLYGEAVSKIVYIKENKTWSGALEYCKSNNGSLISNNQLDRTRTCVQKNEEFWIGKLTILSKWMSLIGCYEIPSATVTTITDANPAVCEHICRGNSKFGLQGTSCLCMNDATIDMSNASADKCGDTCYQEYPTGSCGGNRSYYTVYTRDSAINIKEIEGKGNKCLSAECIKGTNDKQQLTKYARKCSSSLKLLCRAKQKGNTFSTERYRSWIEAFAFCFNENSYLVRPQNYTKPCGPFGTGPIWLSVFRNTVILDINEYLEDDDLYKCSSAKYNGSYYLQNSENECNQENNMKTFFCEIDSISDDGCSVSSTEANSNSMSTLGTALMSNQITTTNLLNNSEENLTHITTQLTSDNSKTGTIIGVVIAVCVLIAIGVVCVVFIYKYRKKQNKKSEYSNSVVEPSVNYVGNQGIENNFGYDLTKPMSHQYTDVMKQKLNNDNRCEFASIQNNNEDNDALQNHQYHTIEMDNRDTGYELASIPKKTESNYVYADTVEGDYDHLNQKNDRKIKNTDEEDKTLYSHTDDHDGTYDTTHTKSYTNDTSDTYDHAKTLNSAAYNVCEDDPYDHTNI